jgi:hypothetical protein
VEISAPHKSRLSALPYPLTALKSPPEKRPWSAETVSFDASSLLTCRNIGIQIFALAPGGKWGTHSIVSALYHDTPIAPIACPRRRPVELSRISQLLSSSTSQGIFDVIAAVAQLRRGGAACL